MATAAATREGSTKGREKSGRSKSEPSSTSDLLRPTARIDQFLLMHSARLDNWREITGLAEKWQAGAAQRADLDAAVAAMEAVEGYHAYPGPKLFALLRERIAANDAGGAARLARRISNGLMTRAYRERPSEWDPNAEMGVDEVADIMPPGLEGSERRRPYCEVLFVSAQPAARWPTLADEVRRLRRRRTSSSTSRSSSDRSRTPFAPRPSIPRSPRSWCRKASRSARASRRRC